VKPIRVRARLTVLLEAITGGPRPGAPESQLPRVLTTLQAGTPCALCRIELAKRVEELLLQ
jgi:hypothetical protein